MSGLRNNTASRGIRDVSYDKYLSDTCFFDSVLFYFIVFIMTSI